MIASVARALDVPLVCDPVLRAGGGADLTDAALIANIRAQLLPATEILTPNAAEARRLASAEDLDACGAALLEAGARHVLITGGDEPGDAVVNRWYAAGRPVRRYAWPRLQGSFHGAGCTLAAAIAVLRARGTSVPQALEDAQAYTHRALRAAEALGRGRPIPRRIG
jgi:hydroxymethylpyrimidine/phosphomethylpyrimidine kinase